MIRRTAVGAHLMIWMAVILTVTGAVMTSPHKSVWWPALLAGPVLAALHCRHDLRTNRRTDRSNAAQIQIGELLQAPTTQTVKWHKARPDRITLGLPATLLVGSPQANLAISQAVNRAWAPHHFTVTAVKIRAGRVHLRWSPPSPQAEPTNLDLLKQRTSAVAEQLLGKDVSVDTYITDTQTEDLDSFTIHHGYGARLANRTLQLKASRIISSMLPGQWRTAFDTEHDTITVSRRPPLPDMIARPVEMPRPGTPQWDLIPQAVDEDGRICSWDISGVMAHQLKAGRTRTGKTVSLIGDAIEGARRGYRVYVLDPKRTEFLGLRDWPNVQLVATKVPDQVALIHYLWTLMEDRYRRIEEEGATETDFERVMFLVDEYRQFYGNAKSWWTSVKTSGMPAQCPAFDWIGSLLRMAGACRIHVILGTQRPDAEFVGGEIRDNFSSRAALGPLSPEGARMMFDSEQIGTTIPLGKRGRGTWIGVDGVPKEVQYLYTPDPRKAASATDLALLDQLRPTTATWPKQHIAWPPPDQLDVLADTFPKRPSDDWLKVIGSALDTAEDDDPPEAEETGGEDLSTPEPAGDDLDTRIDQTYAPPSWADPDNIDTGDLLQLDQMWVSVTDTITDPLDDTQTLIDWTTISGDQTGTHSIGGGETATIRKPLP